MHSTMIRIQLIAEGYGFGALGETVGDKQFMEMDTLDLAQKIRDNLEDGQRYFYINFELSKTRSVTNQYRDIFKTFIVLGIDVKTPPASTCSFNFGTFFLKLSTISSAL